MLGQRRRVEEEGDDEMGPEGLDLEDDSLSDGSMVTDDREAADDSDTSNVDEASPTAAPNARKSANGHAARHGDKKQQSLSFVADRSKPVSDTDVMLHGLAIADHPAPPQEMHFDDVAPSPAKSPSAPIVVSSASAVRETPSAMGDRRRQEHEDYKRRRDEDPAFVPNRGAFFMHDHRHAGPAANGFRPFGRGRGRGGRGGIGGPFAPIKYVFLKPFTHRTQRTDQNSHMHRPGDPTTSSPWTHDMHEAVAQAVPRRPRQMAEDEGLPNGTGFIPTCEPNAEPINRTLSTEKHIGNAQVRVLMADMKTPAVFSGIAVKQYTKLPDHRPPLRRDKPVRISLPDNPPRYIFPAIDRSFIFIPRAMRPNQQRGRGKPRSGLGSIGGFSRRTSVFGGSYYGSVYSPSIAASRRSSFVHDRDFLFSPAGSVMSRPPLPVDTNRPIVRLPPGGPMVSGPSLDLIAQLELSAAAQDARISDFPQPQTHPLPQKPIFPENRTASIPMHQPRPQKNISVADIESPTMSQGPPPFQQAFHQQVPLQVANGLPHETHTRQPSYPSQHSTGTPLSQIPERAIHAAPFQPHVYGGAQPMYNQQPYQAQTQQGFYYGPGYSGPGMAPPPAGSGFVPSGQPGMPGHFMPQNQPDQPAAQVGNAAGPPSSNLVAQEVNGMVYYYDASQLPPSNNYPSYSAPQGYQPGVMGMNGVVTPSPDTYYYPQPGMVYYPQ